MSVKNFIKRIPLFGELLRHAYRRLWKQRTEQHFPGSARYWEDRYANRGDSGLGSCGKFRNFKAEVLNDFVQTYGVHTVIEYGCGDGSQLKLARYPNYVGFDVSETILRKCRETFKNDPTKTFDLMEEYTSERALLTLSLDVIYHLVEDEVFENYMRRLFGSSDRYVIIYSSNTDESLGCEGSHVRHRHFTKWIHDNLNHWRLVRHIPNKYPFKGDCEGSFADFYVFEKV